MKKISLFLTAVFFLTATSTLHAQSVESLSSWKKKTEPCVAIEVKATDEIAIESLFDLLKSEKLKGKKSGKTVSFEKVVFPTISNDYINIYAKAEAKGNNNATVYVFLNKGDANNFLSSSSDQYAINNLKSYLNNKYASVAEKANYDNKVDAQKKMIKNSEKDLSNMRKDLEKKIKQKAKLESEIEQLSRDIDSQGRTVDQQNSDLRKLSK